MIYTSFADIPRKRYKLIYADPAWHHKTRSPKGITSRHPSTHYPTMAIEDIRALPVGELAATNCHCMMWTTQPHLEEAFGVLKAWGFRYSSVFKFWLKLNPKSADEAFIELKHFAKGPGHTTRKNVELCLLGRRGAPPRLYKNESDFIIAARRRHSQKPDQMYPILERYGHGPYLELNARHSRPGWDSWGNEVDQPAGTARARLYTIANDSVGPPAPDPDTPMFPRRDVA